MLCNKQQSWLDALNVNALCTRSMKKNGLSNDEKMGKKNGFNSVEQKRISIIDIIHGMKYDFFPSLHNLLDDLSNRERKLSTYTVKRRLNALSNDQT